MTQALRIVVADDEPDMREYFQRVLPRLGHKVVGVAANGRELLEVCRAVAPDLVITDVRMPEMDGIDASATLYQERPLAVLLVSAYNDDATVDRAANDHVLAYLVKPVKQADLSPAIALAWRRFQEMEQIRSELRQAREEPGS